jgi:hypothetical protein
LPHGSGGNPHVLSNDDRISVPMGSVKLATHHSADDKNKYSFTSTSPTILYSTLLRKRNNFYSMFYLGKYVVWVEGAWKLTGSCPMAGFDVEALSYATRELIFAIVNKK